MRMWMVDPTLLCSKHLRGEHVETHMLLSCYKKGRSLQGFVKKGLIQLEKLKERHDFLAQEMCFRGMNHKTPIVENTSHIRIGSVDISESVKELSRRCSECRRRINE